jgi:selenocysteine-specific elongation factor
MLRRAQEFQAESPLALGMPSAEWRAPFRADASLLIDVERILVSRGDVELAGSLVRTPGWLPALNETQKQLLARIKGRIEQAMLEAPSIGELEGQFGSETMSLLRILQEAGVVVQLEQDRYVATVGLDEARRRLRLEMASRDGHEYAASELRQLLGVSRKFLIPLLEHFDREGVTERRSTGRVLHRP